MTDAAAIRRTIRRQVMADVEARRINAATALRIVAELESKTNAEVLDMAERLGIEATP